MYEEAISTRSVTRANAPVMTTGITPILEKSSHHAARRMPIKIRGAPGKIGTIVPRNPTSMHMTQSAHTIHGRAWVIICPGV